MLSAMPVKAIELNNGNHMPAIGLGTWQSAKGEVGDAVETAIHLGYTHIDGAAVYGNEVEIGETYAKLWKEGKVKRSDIYIVSKVWCTDLHKDAVIASCKKTLADLQLDQLDLLLVHAPFRLDKTIMGRPIPTELGKGVIGYSPEMMKETWTQMETLVEQGLVKSIGVSNFTTKKLKDLLEFAKIKPVCNQVEMHPYLPQDGLKQFCDDNGIVCVAYSPLGAPKRPAFCVKDEHPVLLSDSVLKSIAERKKCTVAQVLINWAIQRGTAVLPKSVTPSRIEENLKAAEIDLDTDDMTAINGIKTRIRYLDQSFARKVGETVEDLMDGEFLG